MQLNLTNMRFGAIAAGVVLVAMYWMCGGYFGTEQVIQIEFGMYAEEFEGLEVEIDGDVVGKLKMHGQATRSGFSVSEGTHRICVRHPDLPCTPAIVDTELAGQKVLLLLDIEENFSGTRSSPTLILRM